MSYQEREIPRSLNPERFDGKDFLQWKERAIAFLIMKKQWKIIKTKVESGKELTDEQVEARAYLMLLLSDNIMCNYLHMETGNAIWEALQDRYLRVNPAEVNMLVRKMRNVKLKDHQNVDHYIQELNKLKSAIM